MLEHPPDLSPVFNIDAVSKVPSSCWGPLSCPLRISTLNEQALKKWCPDSESNQGHGDFQSPALPTELSGQRGALNRNPSCASTKFLDFPADCLTLRQFCRERGILLVHHIIPLSPSRIFQPLTAEITRRNPDTE